MLKVFLSILQEQFAKQPKILHIALQYVSLETIKYLIDERKAPLFHEDEQGRYPFNLIQNRAFSHNGNNLLEIASQCFFLYRIK